MCDCPHASLSLGTLAVCIKARSICQAMVELRNELIQTLVSKTWIRAHANPCHLAEDCVQGSSGIMVKSRVTVTRCDVSCVATMPRSRWLQLRVFCYLDPGLAEEVLLEWWLTLVHLELRASELGAVDTIFIVDLLLIYAPFIIYDLLRTSVT